MLPVSSAPSFHSPIPAIQAGPSSPYPANSLNTSPRRNPIYIAELREEIEAYITDKKTKLAYFLAWAIPTLKSGEAFDSLAHMYFLAQSSTLFRESKQELDNQLRNFDIQEKQQLSEQEITLVKQSRQACESDITKIERERQARYQAIMNGTSELRALMLQQPTHFNTQNAEKFAHRYQQVATFLRTTEEYGEALTGFKQFLESGAYTSNSNPTLDGVKQIQKELLEKWFRRISISAKIGLKEQSKSEAEFLSVKAFFLKDPKKPALRREHQTSVERVGRDLRRLAEEPKERLSSILRDLTLARSTPKNPKKICLNHLVYGALIEYLPTLPQASAKLILERLAAHGLGGMPKVLKSIFFEKLKLYPHSEIYDSLEKVMGNLSFSEKKLILEDYPNLPRKGILNFLKLELECIPLRQDIEFFDYLYDYIESIPERTFRSNLNNFMELIESVCKLDQVKIYGEIREGAIFRNAQSKIIDLIEKYIKKLPSGATGSLLMGIPKNWLLFSNDKRYQLINVIKKNLPGVSNKEGVITSIVNNLDGLPRQRERDFIIELISPYLDGSHSQQLSLSVLRILLSKSEKLSLIHRINVMNWIIWRLEHQVISSQ